MIKLPPDITFVIQLVGFVVFWQLMRAILFVPVQRALKTRAEHTSGARAQAGSLTTEAAALTAEVDARLTAARLAGAHQAEEIRRRAEAAEHATLARYREQSAALLERERAVTSAQVEAARAPLESEAARLAERVVLKVLGRAA